MKVSAVIPAFNREGHLKGVLENCFAQTVPPDEAVVVDDGSTDGTWAALSEMAARDARVRPVRLEKNSGAQAARIAGVKAARGEWIAFLDTDDRWLPRAIESRLSAAEKAPFEAGLVYGDARYSKKMNRPVLRYKRHAGDAFPWLCRELILARTSAIMVRRRCFDESGWPTESFPSFQDQDLTMTVARHFPVLHCGDTVADILPTPGQITSDPARMIAGYRMLIEKYRDDVLRLHGRGRLLTLYASLQFMRLRAFYLRLFWRHYDLAVKRTSRLDPVRVADAAFCRAVGALLDGFRLVLRARFENKFVYDL